MRHSMPRSVWLIVATIGMVFGGLPARGSAAHTYDINGVLSHASQVVLNRYLISNPGQAPADVQTRYENLARYARQVRAAQPFAEDVVGPLGTRMNHDVFSLPQNEESVAACSSHPKVVIEGTNDYRGLLNDEVNFTGWHLSLDGATSLAKEGLLPSIETLASAGDPAYRSDRACRLFAASLNFNAFDPLTPGTNGIGAYRSDVPTLKRCDTSQEPFHSDPACWPNRILVSTNKAGHFLDKEWLDVGDTGDGNHVWVTWSDFDCSQNPSCGVPFTASIWAARCEYNLSSCKAPQKLSGEQNDIQFSYVTIGPDKRTYVTWAQIFGELTETAQHFRIWMRVADRGSTSFGPTRFVADIDLPLPFGGLLHANNFRIASVPKNTVALVDGRPWVFVVWDECAARPLDTVCEEPVIKLARSGDLGQTWQRRTIFAGADNYFPSIDWDQASGNLAVAFYTSRNDPPFHNGQDIQLLTVNPANGAVTKSQRLTRLTNDPDADWLFSSGFIGDYIEVTAVNGEALVGFNANAHKVRIFGSGVPVPQQDNYITRGSL